MTDTTYSEREEEMLTNMPFIMNGKTLGEADAFNLYDWAECAERYERITGDDCHGGDSSGAE